jgi:hypothetical protein
LVGWETSAQIPPKSYLETPHQNVKKRKTQRPSKNSSKKLSSQSMREICDPPGKLK